LINHLLGAAIVMSAQPLTVDYRQEAAPLQILPNMPLLSSHQSSWNTIHLAHHRQPASVDRKLM